MVDCLLCVVYFRLLGLAEWCLKPSEYQVKNAVWKNLKGFGISQMVFYYSDDHQCIRTMENQWMRLGSFTNLNYLRFLFISPVHVYPVWFIMANLQKVLQFPRGVTGCFPARLLGRVQPLAAVACAVSNCLWKKSRAPRRPVELINNFISTDGE